MTHKPEISTLRLFTESLPSPVPHHPAWGREAGGDWGTPALWAMGDLPEGSMASEKVPPARALHAPWMCEAGRESWAGP